MELEIEPINRLFSFFQSCHHLLSQLGAEGHVPGVVLLRVVHRDRGHLCQVSVVLSVLDCLRKVGGTWLVVEERTKDEEGLADEARHLWTGNYFWK